jgi:hypothetical protein
MINIYKRKQKFKVIKVPRKLKKGLKIITITLMKKNWKTKYLRIDGINLITNVRKGTILPVHKGKYISSIRYFDEYPIIQSLDKI